MTRKFAWSLLLLFGFTLGFTGISASAASAPSVNQTAIRQQLQQGTLFLRGRYVCPIPAAAGSQTTTIHKHQKTSLVSHSMRKNSVSCDLSFDSQGNLNTPAEKGPLALSAVQINRVQFKTSRIILLADRSLIVRQNSASEPFTIQLQPPAHLQITIALKPSQPEALQSALKKIFSQSLAQSLAAETQQEHNIDLASLPILALQTGREPETSPTPIGLPGDKDVATLAGSEPPIAVTAPRPIYVPELRYTRQARKQKIQGACTLRLTVSKDGFPEHIRVVQSLPDGLDERAIAALSQYRFQPALEAGKPVAVKLVVAINFAISRRAW